MQQERFGTVERFVHGSGQTVLVILRVHMIQQHEGPETGRQVIVNLPRHDRPSGALVALDGIDDPGPIAGIFVHLLGPVAPAVDGQAQGPELASPIRSRPGGPEQFVQIAEGVGDPLANQKGPAVIAPAADLIIETGVLGVDPDSQGLHFVGHGVAGVRIDPALGQGAAFDRPAGDFDEGFRQPGVGKDPHLFGVLPRAQEAGRDRGKGPPG